MAPAHQVYQNVFQQAREAGYPVDAANQYAALLAARYETRAERLGPGTDAYAQYQAAGPGSGVVIRNDVSPALRNHFGRLDPVIDALRKGDDGKQPGPRLSDFLSKLGGVKDEGGELSAMDADKWHVGKPFAKRLVNDAG